MITRNRGNVGYRPKTSTTYTSQTMQIKVVLWSDTGILICKFMFNLVAKKSVCPDNRVVIYTWAL